MLSMHQVLVSPSLHLWGQVSNQSHVLYVKTFSRPSFSFRGPLQPVSCPVCQVFSCLRFPFRGLATSLMLCVCQVLSCPSFPFRGLATSLMSCMSSTLLSWLSLESLCTWQVLSRPGFSVRGFATSLMSCMESWLLWDLRYTVNSPYAVHDYSVGVRPKVLICSSFLMVVS
jgi:hypothetical protein